MGSEFLRSWVSSCGYSLDVVGPDGPRTLQRGYVASTALANHWFRFDVRDGVLQVNHQPLSLEQYAQKMGDLLLSGTVVDRQADAAGVDVKAKQTAPARAGRRRRRPLPLLPREDAEVLPRLWRSGEARGQVLRHVRPARCSG